MKFITKMTVCMLTLACAVIVSPSANASENRGVERFDVRKHIPNGTTFNHVPKGFTIAYINGHIVVTRGHERWGPVAEGIDGERRLTYTATAPMGSTGSSDVLMISGTLDATPLGTVVTFDVMEVGGGIVAGKITDMGGGGIFFVPQTCDCDDQIGTGCNVNKCRDKSPCNAGAPANKCKWFPMVDDDSPSPSEATD